MATPSLQGFRDAQAKLRATFGEDVPFFTPQTATWPAGTPIDPETSLPFDPVVQPLASGWGSAVVRASVVARPMGLSRRGTDDTIRPNAVGNFEEGNIVLIVGYEDWQDAELDDATQVEVHGERYTITETEQDQLGPGEPERMLAYCTQGAG